MKRWRRRTRSTKDRGASLPEYALLLAGMAVGVLFAVETATGHTADTIESGHEVTEGDSFAFGTGSTTSSSTTSPGSSTTFPTIPTTTTTIATTTTSTTAPATTTTTAPAMNHVDLVSKTSTWDNSPTNTRWSVFFTVRLTKNGVNVPSGVVTVNLEATGGGTTTVNSCITNSSGVCTINRGNINSSRPAIIMTVTNTTSPWDGVATTATQAKPV